jgi:chromosome segregation ATPase
LSPLAEDWVALIDKRVETKITSLSQSFTKSEKKLGELEDSVAGIDQLMTVVQGTSNENSISLKLMEKEFANLKADNATKLKEINIKQTRATIMENEIQRLKDDTSTKLKAIEVCTFGMCGDLVVYYVPRLL